MGRNNFVYEDLLKSYLKVRTAKQEKEQTTAAQIAEAEKSIEVNKKLMAEAISTGDQERYTDLFTANTKSEASISFFKGVLDMLKKEDISKSIDTDDLQRKASVEINKIIEQYNEEFIRLMQPIIDLSVSTATQVNILRLAKAKIAKNIEGAADSSVCSTYKTYSYDGMDLIKVLDKLLQSYSYTQTDKNCDMSKDISLGAIRNFWDKAAKEKYMKECAKWI